MHEKLKPLQHDKNNTGKEDKNTKELRLKIKQENREMVNCCTSVQQPSKYILFFFVFFKKKKINNKKIRDFYAVIQHCRKSITLNINYQL